MRIPGRLAISAAIAAVLLALTASCPAQTLPSDAATEPSVITSSEFLKKPQWTTGSRLLKLGESIRFHFFVPDVKSRGVLTVFPRYLENADPACDFQGTPELSWLERLPREVIPLPSAGPTVITYTPTAPGNYLARWQTGNETLYRHFAVVENDSIVLRFSTFDGLDPQPALHRLGVPLDYYLKVERFHPGDPLFQTLLNYHRIHGDSITPALPDTPDLSQAERTRMYRSALDKVAAQVPDAGSLRSVRLMANHPRDPGYTSALVELGVNNHCDLQESNAVPWLGMPEFPYFSSTADCRAPSQSSGATVVAHQWDFCGGWHFLGSVGWHYQASHGNWEAARQCLSDGIREYQNLAQLSGHPAFVFPLYDGADRYDYPRAALEDVAIEDGRTHASFVERYHRLIGFEFPRKYKVVYARSLDVADYYRRHFPLTPRTVFVSSTSHLMYDMWWLCTWAVEHNLVTRQRIPWLSRISRLSAAQERFKDPLSCEYLLIEDHQRSIRFERESPHPVWWFDYADLHHTPDGRIARTVAADMDVVDASGAQAPDVGGSATASALSFMPSWRKNERGYWLKLRMASRDKGPEAGRQPGESRDYAICLWDLPPAFAQRPDAARISTNASEFVLARNCDGEYHLVLFFRLKPDALLDVKINEP